ncbi:MAG: GTP-binding protein, partial [Desulfurococcaceae archaeon]
MAVEVYILSGHFGCGKTTLLLRLSRILADDGVKVAALVNDVGSVDSRMAASSLGCPVEDVSSRCLCARGGDVASALRRLVDGG